jgi:UDPglucose--hexose-1-phosphate uridylyltransferase
LPEIRIDPLTGLRAIVAGDRANRPGGGLTAPPAQPLDRETDPFAEGHEDRTPPEVYAVRPNGGAPNTPGWTVRVVPNLYPALSENSPHPEPEANPDLFWAGPAKGAHEVIVNAPDPVISLSEL